MALRERTPKPDGSFEPMIHHSDRRVQYCSHEYTNLLRADGIAIGMTEKGDPYEKAIAERINGILKYEFNLIRPFKDQAEVCKAVTQAVRLYNYEHAAELLNWEFLAG